MQKRTGISLIVLVITIIVMIILAGAIILTLNNSGIIDKATDAVEQANLATVKELAQLGWAEAYAEGARTETELKVGVDAAMTKNKIDMSKYDIVITTSGVTVRLKTQIPGEWQTNVVDIVDDVPIPKGFVASQATGENTKNGGLVIYEGTTPVTDANVEDAKRARNQYVWVPVEDFSEFVRGAYNDTTYSNVLGTDSWEVVLDTTTNMPLSTQDTNYMTSATLAEVQAMYESVKEYKGFYIARYETGIDTQRTAMGNASDLPGIKQGTKVYSVMGKIPYTYIPWAWNDSMSEDTNGAVEVARRMYPVTNTNYGVVSTLTYGVQWDRTLAWWLDVDAKDGKGNTITSVTDSSSYGNYSDHVIAVGDLNDGARYAVYDNIDTYTLGSYQEATSSSTKANGICWALSTGALKTASVNNICDMAGNMYEWTMEALHGAERIVRGGGFNYDGVNHPVSYRDYYMSPRNTDFLDGFRHTLYIKK